jgi:hypothetical protein
LIQIKAIAVSEANLRESDCVQSPTETRGAPKAGRGAYRDMRGGFGIF